MSTRPTPVEVMELRGAYMKNPKRRKAKAPKSARPLGAPYAWMNEDERALWVEIADDLAPGVATSADRLAFAGWVRLAARFMAGEKFTAADHSQFRNYASMFGASPADRAKLALPKSTEKDELEDEFFGEN